VSCTDGGDGTITLTVSNGLSPYTFAWTTSDGSGLAATDQDQTGLIAGTYDVVVTDQNGCTAAESVEITEPIVLTATITGGDVSCYDGNDGTATLTVTGGTPTHTFSWENSVPAVISNTQNLTGLVADTYSVTVTDGLGCTASDIVVIDEPTLIIPTLTATDVACYNGNDGSIDLEVTGGTPFPTGDPYNYSWSNSETTEDISGLTAIAYSVEVTDNNSCTVTDNITINQPTQIITSITPTNVSCNSGNDGEADLNVSGGTTGYTYSWTNSVPAVIATSEDVTGLTLGTYYVTVTDANSCVATDDVTITQPTLLSASASGTDVSCFGGSDGTATVAPTGGTIDYTYSWSTTPESTTQDISDLEAGTYYVTVYDDLLCEATSSIVIEEPIELSLSIDGTDVKCFGGSDGAAIITLGGGTPTHTYAWSNSATTGNITDLIAGTYDLEVTDGLGCTIAESVVIDEPAELEVTIAGTDALCFEGETGIACI